MHPTVLDAQTLFAERFAWSASHLSFAPGRVEFIGNHTDYNGGLVLGASLDMGVAVAAGAGESGRARIATLGNGEAVEVDLARLAPLTGTGSWANYPLGVIDEVAKLGQVAPSGISLAIASNLPPGAGLSSSAALELATAYALSGLLEFELPREEMARLGRRAENNFVGVPCGILDQGVSAFGETNALVRIDCRAETFSTVPLPEGTAFHIFNTGLKHALVDSFYADRHGECMRARDAIQAVYPEVEYLSLATDPQRAAAKLEAVLDKRAHHIITENARVKQVCEALEQGDLEQAGACLYASHESSRDNFENSVAELDFLVEQLRQQPEVIGARLTGGGFGGAVLAFTKDTYGEAQAAIIKQAYRTAFSEDLTWIPSSTGPGAHQVTG
ncbi:MAG: galactokinase [Opitutales bacterium]